MKLKRCVGVEEGSEMFFSEPGWRFGTFVVFAVSSKTKSGEWSCGWRNVVEATPHFDGRSSAVDCRRLAGS